MRAFPLALMIPALLISCGAAQEPDAPAPNADQAGGESTEPMRVKAAKVMPLPGLKRVTEDYDVFVDLKNKFVVVDGWIVLREGQLELFACPVGTKTHESVVAVNTKAKFVHASLLAVGAKVGKPVQFNPEYVAATGQKIKVEVMWKDKQGQTQRTNAQQWVQNVKTGKPMTADWVFGGSGFYADPQSGEVHYLAEDGDLICVSNFPTATLDLPIKSSSSQTALLFACNTQAIPPLDTPVRVILTPVADKPAEPREASEKKDPPQE